MRFSIKQLMMAVALIAILLVFWRTEGCGTRSSAIESLSFSPDGARLLVSRIDARDARRPGKAYLADVARTVSILDAIAGDVSFVLCQDVRKGNQGPAFRFWRFGATTASAHFDSSGTRIVVQEFGGGRVSLYSADRSGPPRVLVGAGADSLRLAVSQSAPLVAVCAGGHVAVVDLEDDRVLCRITPAWPAYFVFASFSPDGTLLAASSGMGVDAWDARTGAHLHQVIAENVEPPELAIAFRDADTILVGSGAGLAEYTLAGQSRVLPPYADACAGIAVSRDGGRVAAARYDDVDIYGEKRDAIVRIPTPQTATAIALSPDGTWLAIGDSTGRVALYDAVSGRQSWTVSAPGRYRPPWTAPAAALVVWMLICGGLAMRSLRRARLLRANSANQAVNVHSAAAALPASP
jgi:WD40 repeat protein